MPLNLKLMLPLSAIITLLCSGKYSLIGLSLSKKLLISLLFVLMFLNLLFFKLGELSIVLPFLVYPAALLLASVLVLDREFILGMANLICFIFLIDCFFNVYTLLTLSDLFGRPVDFRINQGDIFPRLGGIYASSFVSTGISMSAFLASLVNKNRLITFLVICFMIVTGSLRSPVLLLVALCGVIVSYFIKGRFKIFFLAVMCGLCVFAGIFLLSDITSNATRIGALTFGATEIFASPIFGNSGYTPFDYKTGVTLEKLIDSGNAEQQLMNIGIHFGVPLLLIFMILIYSLIPKINNKLSHSSNSNDLFVKRVCIFIIIVDLMVTHLFSFFPFTVFSLIIMLRLGVSKEKYKSNQPTLYL